jgi:hypothetical protein
LFQAFLAEQLLDSGKARLGSLQMLEREMLPHELPGKRGLLTRNGQNEVWM